MGVNLAATTTRELVAELTDRINSGGGDLDYAREPLQVIFRNVTGHELRQTEHIGWSDGTVMDRQRARGAVSEPWGPWMGVTP